MNGSYAQNPPVKHSYPDPAESPFGALTSEEKTAGMLCHLLALCGLLPIPFAAIIGPLIFWIIKKDTSPFVDDQGKESLNFQISIAIYLICCIPLIFIVIGILFMIVIGIGSTIMVIVASVRTASGRVHRYPMTIRFLS